MEDTSFWIPPNMMSSPLIGVEVKCMFKQLLSLTTLNLWIFSHLPLTSE